MSLERMSRHRLPGVLVPAALVADPARFGGTPQCDCLAGDLVVEEGRAIRLMPSAGAPTALLLPRLTEAHVHLDKCHTIDRIRSVGSDLAAAIEAQRADKALWSADDIHARATRAIAELSASGCGVVRTHVDFSNDQNPEMVPLAWDILGDVAGSSDVRLQRAALVGIEQLSQSDYARRCATRLARDGGVLGAFLYNQPERCDGLINAFREAERLGLSLDFHVDEGLAFDLDGLEMVTDVAMALGHQGPVLCGHGCSLSIRDGETRKRTADKLALTGISLAVLPTTNLYLQGRGPEHAQARGLAPLRELRSAGVNVVVGTDNVRDAFYPTGRHDPLHTLSLAVPAAHLDPPFGGHLPMITTAARTALGLPPHTVDGADIEDLVVFDVRSTSDLVAGGPSPRALTGTLLGEPK